MSLKERLLRLERAKSRLHTLRNPFDELTDEELEKELEILEKHLAGIPLDDAELRHLTTIQACPHVPGALDDMNAEELEAELARLERLQEDPIERG